MSDRKTRKSRGFIWGADQADLANLSWFELAARQTDSEKEEYYYQSVFNSPDYARNIVKEVNQKNRRNNVLINTDDDSYTDDASEDDSIVSSSRYIDDSYQEGLASENRPESMMTLVKGLRAIVDNIEEAHCKVIAFYMVKSGVNNMLNNDSRADLHELSEHMTHFESIQGSLYKSHLMSYLGGGSKSLNVIHQVNIMFRKNINLFQIEGL